MLRMVDGKFRRMVDDIDFAYFEPHDDTDCVSHRFGDMKQFPGIGLLLKR